jgi:hypothetical protein
MARGRTTSDAPPLAGVPDNRVRAHTNVRARVAEAMGKFEKDVQTSLRLPGAMYEALMKAADEHGTGIGEEIRRRLERSFASEPPSAADPRFADLLATIVFAASAAAKMYPARQIDYDGEPAEDITAQWLFEGCLEMLLDAFRPFGFPASLPEDRHAARAELLRRADRIVGGALASLGERGADAFGNLAVMDQETIASSGPIGRALAAKAERREQEEKEAFIRGTPAGAKRRSEEEKGDA